VPIPAGRITPDDERLMQEVTCRRCATSVLVSKNTPTQTSIQWLDDAGQICSELAGQRAAGRPTGLVSGCTALRESIEDAVREGRVQVLFP
jgi:hypothetical protein